MSERIIPFPDKTISRMRRLTNLGTRFIDVLRGRRRAIDQEPTKEYLRADAPVPLRAFQSTQERDQQLAEDWESSRSTGFGTNPNGAFFVDEKVVPSGENWTVVKNLDPRVRVNRAKGSNRLKRAATKSQLRIVEG